MASTPTRDTRKYSAPHVGTFTVTCSTVEASRTVAHALQQAIGKALAYHPTHAQLFDLNRK